MRISDWSSDVCSSDLELTGGGLGEGFGELDFTRIFVGGDGGLHVSLELGGELGRRPVTRRDDDEGFHFLPALLTGGADYRAFLNGGMREERILHLRRGDLRSEASRGGKEWCSTCR